MLSVRLCESEPKPLEASVGCFMSSGRLTASRRFSLMRASLPLSSSAVDSVDSLMSDRSSMVSVVSSSVLLPSFSETMIGRKCTTYL